MALNDPNEHIISEMAAAFAAQVAGSVPREEILAPFDGTDLEELAFTALCRAQWAFIMRRHEALHGPLPEAVAV